MNYFEDCHYCVPPERHPGCHATCPRYAEGKARYEADKAEANKKITLKYYANEKHAEAIDNVAKYPMGRHKRYRRG